MPWKVESETMQRNFFIEQMLLPGANISQLCQRANISRKTAYKWLKRYQEHGFEGLLNKSRRPRLQPKRTSAEVEQLIIETHKNYPFWGPYKLQQFIKNEGFVETVPSHPTIAKILKRHDCEVIKSNRSAAAKIRFEHQQP